MSRKILAMLLVLSMVLSMVPMAMAAETDAKETQPATTETQPQETTPEGTDPEGTTPAETKPEESKKVFTDVAETDWFVKEVMWAYEQGLVKGTSTTEFSPNMNITRGMVVTILHRYEKEPKVEGTQFADVKKDDYFAMPVLWASSKGIVTGYDKTTFGPNDGITREQIAAILFRYAKVKGLDVTVPKDASLKAFPDAAKVSDYAKEAMLWAVNAKLINGIKGEKETTLEPQGSATRAQVATLLYRLFNDVMNPPHVHAYGDWTAKDGKVHTKTCANTDKKCDKLTISENCVYTKDTEKCDVCGFADGKTHITTAEQLLAFAKKVNGDEKNPADNFAGKTVQLEADIDLKELKDLKLWTPIGTEFDTAFCGIFDGQGHTIKNLTVGDEKSTDPQQYMGLFGAIVGTVKNLNLDTVKVFGNHYVGGIVGYAYGEISGCTVKNAEIAAVPFRSESGYDDGDKVGGIVGYLASEPDGIISKCAVENAKLSGYRDVGGLAGMVNAGEGAEATVSENTVTKVQITADQSKCYYGYKNPNAGGTVGRIDVEDEKVVVTKNTEKDVTVNLVVTAADNKPLAADLNGTAYSDVALALKAAATTPNAELTILKAGSYTLPTTFQDNTTIICRVEGVTFSVPRSNSDGMYYLSASDFSLYNATINTEVTFTGHGTFQDVDFTGSNGLRKSNLFGDSKFVNCTFPATDMCAFQADWISGNVLFENCAFSGLVSYAGLEDKTVTFTECTFKNNGPYGELAAQIPTVLDKCDTSDIKVDYTTALFKVDGAYIITKEWQLHQAAAIAEATLDLQLIPDKDENGKDIPFALHHDLVLAEKVTVKGNNTVIPAEGYGIVTVGGTIQNLSLVGNHNGLMAGDLASDLVLEGITVDEGNIALNVPAGNGKKLTVKDSKLYGETTIFNLASAAFTGCTFGQGKSNGEGYLLTGCVTTFDKCAFEKGFKMGAWYPTEEEGKKLSVKLTDCTYDGAKLTADTFAMLMVKKQADDPEYAAKLRDVTVTVDKVAVGKSSYT